MKMWPLFAFVMLMLVGACSTSATAPAPTEEPTQVGAAATPTPVPLTPTLTPPSPTPVPPTPTSQVTLPAGEGPCTITAQVDTPAYTRPDERADLFGFLGAGQQVMAEVRTADGWLGFDPGVAQAGNVGLFRYRWILLDPAVTAEGNCAGLPVVEKLPAEVCFAAAFDETPVRAEPRADAEVVATLVFEQYVAVTGRAPDGSWVQVDLETGNVRQPGTGWVELSTVSLNGPCE